MITNTLSNYKKDKEFYIRLFVITLPIAYYFLFSLLTNCIAIGSGVLIAQLWGKKDTINIKRTLSRSLFYSLVLTIVFMILGLIMPNKIMAIFNNDPTVIKIGVDYLKIVVISYLFTTITFTFASGLRSIGTYS